MIQFRCPSTNSVDFAGHLCADPVLSAGKRLMFRIACNRNYRRGDAWATEATFAQCVLWGAQAERRADLKKGDAVLISGRLRSTSWVKDGQTRYGMEIVCAKVEILNRKLDHNAAVVDDEVALQASDDQRETAVAEDPNQKILDELGGARAFELPLVQALANGVINGTQFEELAALAASTTVTFTWDPQAKELTDADGIVIELDTILEPKKTKRPRKSKAAAAA